ncbi:hypothetical protein BB560_004365 [Smittium megazygosporum]|uniref:Uncharacterized protein n=1 Tax=Smittium megazygosporum TaxID=133381 RepID=A0A2T9Z9E7_9FUNG|nr:hypothetical protein BB560_004365 [Smittium megazygosporum]
MISALAWVRKGIASQHPKNVEYTEEELLQFEKEAQAEIEAANESAKQSLASQIPQQVHSENTDNYDDLAEFHMEDYGNEEPMGNDQQVLNSKSALSAKTDGQDNDPYLDLEDDGNKSEMEELEIDPRDNLLVAAKTNLDISSLEIYVYEGEMENLYVHHDIMLPSPPLCIEWIGCSLGRQAPSTDIGNFVAVGTFEPTIEIWNLDLLDPVIPDVTLGSKKSSSFSSSPFVNKKSKRKDKKNKNKQNNKFDDDLLNANLSSHTDAVMSLSWNKNAVNILASSSADKTVKLWDLKTSTCAKTFTHHSDKVQAVQWHPSQPPVLITGSFDKSVAVVDSRSSSNKPLSFKLDADVEGVNWDIHNENCFYTNLENGQVVYYDIRSHSASKESAKLFTIEAHTYSSCSSLDIHPTIKNCIVTAGSDDKTVKIWNTKNASNSISLVTSRNLDIGKLFSCRFCPDSMFEVALAGDGGSLVVWDMMYNPGVVSSFSLDTKNLKKKSKPIVTVSTNNYFRDSEDENPDVLITELQSGANADELSEDEDLENSVDLKLSNNSNQNEDSDIEMD